MMLTGKIKLIVAMCAVAAVLLGCSAREQFSKAAGPLAAIVSTDLNASASVPPTAKEQAAAMSAAATAGDKAAVVSTWFGVGNVREAYVTYLSSDPRFASVDGATLKGIKQRKVDQFDYVLSIGSPAPPK